MAIRRTAKDAPRLVAGRKGLVSVVDAMIQALWKETGRARRGELGENWPALTIAEIHEEASRVRQKEIPRTTIRCELYRHQELFERCSTEETVVRYRLTASLRK